MFEAWVQKALTFLMERVFSHISMIQFILDFRFMRAIPHSYIAGNIGSPL